MTIGILRRRLAARDVIVGFVYRDKQELQEILRDVKTFPNAKVCIIREDEIISG